MPVTLETLAQAVILLEWMRYGAMDKWKDDSNAHAAVNAFTLAIHFLDVEMRRLDSEEEE